MCQLYVALQTTAVSGLIYLAMFGVAQFHQQICFFFIFMNNFHFEAELFW